MLRKCGKTFPHTSDAIEPIQKKSLKNFIPKFQLSTSPRPGKIDIVEYGNTLASQLQELMDYHPPAIFKFKQFLVAFKVNSSASKGRWNRIISAMHMILVM